MKIEGLNKSFGDIKIFEKMYKFASLEKRINRVIWEM